MSERVETLKQKRMIAMEKVEGELGREMTDSEKNFFRLGFNHGLFAYEDDAVKRFGL